MKNATMMRCKLTPKSGIGAVWYCRVNEIFKKYASAYSLEGYHYYARMADYNVEDATHNRIVAEVLRDKPLER
jgi:hypothetical protein